jgi:hypothetical protein
MKPNQINGIERKLEQDLLLSLVRPNVNEEVQVDRGNIVMRTAEWVANVSGSITFLVVHVIFFAMWIGVNTGNMEEGALRFANAPPRLRTYDTHATCALGYSVSLGCLLVERSRGRDRPDWR